MGSETNTETRSQIQPRKSSASSAFWGKELGQEAQLLQKEPQRTVMERTEITVQIGRKEKAVTCSREWMGRCPGPQTGKTPTPEGEGLISPGMVGNSPCQRQTVGPGG